MKPAIEDAVTGCGKAAKKKKEEEVFDGRSLHPPGLLKWRLCWNNLTLNHTTKTNSWRVCTHCAVCAELKNENKMSSVLRLPTTAMLWKQTSIVRHFSPSRFFFFLKAPYWCSFNADGRCMTLMLNYNCKATDDSQSEVEINWKTPQRVVVTLRWIKPAPTVLGTINPLALTEMKL